MAGSRPKFKYDADRKYWTAEIKGNRLGMIFLGIGDTRAASFEDLKERVAFMAQFESLSRAARDDAEDVLKKLRRRSTATKRKRSYASR